ncbi:aldehyde dehydrogenase family protein [Alteribacter natronophilus]|uniref:aldehyde dehydrogenase family protein n=1 Tax=Alteribacter natronophilus TaxID=2583810 RepID=UPI00110EAB57|nr:aldehyde dehydrogenase family protein [Alteribacter natronophilus]TMW72263.1 aldehyde dehydrogenase family protein [Alteribacter natronophilus]
MSSERLFYPHIIGEERTKNQETIDVANKYDNSVMASVYRGKEEEVNRAVAEARKTFEKSQITPSERGELLRKAAKLFAEKKEEIAQTISAEVGKVIRDARMEVDRGVQTFLAAAEEVGRITGHTVPIENQKGNENRLAFTIRQPVGVIGAITPFNFPFNLTAHKLAPALAAGNTVVLKPAEKTPVSAMMLVDVLLEAGFPPGTINVVNGFGHEAGDALLRHPDVDMYTFTGSPDVGKIVKSTTGIRKVTLELGSNAPNIVHSDASDLSEVAKSCVEKGMMHNGQACISVQRVYVHDDCLEEFLTYAREAAENLKVGNPQDDDTRVGPLIDEKSAERIEEWVNEAVSSGARVVSGGRRDGAIYYPTVLTDVKPEMKVVCEEVFAPVVVVVPYSDIHDAIRQANDSRFGLQVGVFTTNIDLAMNAAKQLRYGGVILNDVSTFRADTMPYGGIKDSGVGKEGPKYAIEEMTDEKIIVINTK